MPNKTKQNHTTRKQKMLTTTIQITNNPPHTPPTPHTPTKQQGAPKKGQQHASQTLNGVEREPDSVFASTELASLFSTKNTHAPTPTKKNPSEQMRAQETHTKHTRVPLMRIPKKRAP